MKPRPAKRASCETFLKNLLTDIAGVRVGHADDTRLASGVTAVIFDSPAVAAIDVRGGRTAAIDSGLTFGHIGVITGRRRSSTVA
jgi:L-aminopeptidase/D-esterase-like protein